MPRLTSLLPILGLLFACTPAHAVPAHQVRGVVFVVDEAGGHDSLYDGLREVVCEARLPLQIVRVNWTTGSCHDDIKNQQNSYEQGRKLAARILAVPYGYKVYVIGYGMGAGVVLNAAECLPYHSVSRIILLAPAVTCSYDLKPALYASCEGIDSYFSSFDKLQGRMTHWFGTADGAKGRKTKVAGLVGFAPQIECPRDAALYMKLRQHRFDMNMDPSHDGDHRDYYDTRFLQCHIVRIFRYSLGLPTH